MSEWTFTDRLSPEKHDEFVKNSPLSNLLQSAAWARIKDNWTPIYTGVLENGNPVAAGLILKKELPLGFSFFYIPRGPVLDYQNEKLVNYTFKNLRKLAKKHRALFIKMDPAIELFRYKMEDPKRDLNRIEPIVAPLEKAGAKYQGPVMEIGQSIQPRHHAVIFKTDDYFETLPKKTKKWMKEADKRDVEIISGKEELLDQFASLVEKTEARKGVSLRNRAYFEKLLKAYPQDSIIMLAVIRPKQLIAKKKKELDEIETQLSALAENQKKKRFTLEEKKQSVLKDLKSFEDLFSEDPSDEPLPIAGVLTVIYGNQAEMLYAGMDETFRRFMPQYKQYVENIKWAFEQGCTEFSMGGIEGDLKDGLSHFKNHFNPQVVEYIGEFDLPVYKTLYPVSKKLFERVKGRL